MEATILLHKIEWWYNEEDNKAPETLPESEEEHIQKMIIDWCREWELCYTDQNENEFYWYWKIQFQKELSNELDRILIEIKDKLDSSKKYIDEWYSETVRELWWIDDFEELVETEWELSPNEEVARQVWKSQALLDLHYFITNLK